LVTYYEGAILKTQNYYEYDEFNQLIIEDVFISGGTSKTFVYEYDLRGNRTAGIQYAYGYRTGGVTYDPATLTNTGTISVTPYVNGQIYSEPVIVDIGDAFPSISFSFIDGNGYSYSIVPSDGTTNFVNFRKGFYYHNYWAYVYMGNQTINCHFSIVLNVGDIETSPGVSQKEYQFEYSEEWLDQLEKYDIIIGGLVTSSHEYEYDAQGNPVSISNFDYDRNAVLVWDGRQLTEIQLYNTSNVWQKTISYRYNDQGYRIQKITETSTGTTITDYTLSGDKVLRETDGIWEMVYAYDYNGTLIGFNYDSNIADATEGLDYFYLFNQQGDITGIVNSSGTAVLKYRYDAFGTRTIPSFTTEGIKFMTLNPYTYRGYRYDTDTGLYYLNSRYYNPQIGRFLNADGMLGEIGDILSTNMYAYCANNPVIFFDPEGESLTLLVILVSSLLAFAIIATTPADSVDGNNLSVSAGGSSDSFIAGGESMGVGYEIQVNVPGTTCNISGECSDYTTLVAGQLGPFGGSLTTNDSGSQSVSISFLIFDVSLDMDNTFDNVSVGMGLSFSYSAGLPFVGGSSVSYDIDFLGLVVDAFRGNGDE